MWFESIVLNTLLLEIILLIVYVCISLVPNNFFDTSNEKEMDIYFKIARMRNNLGFLLVFVLGILTIMSMFL